MRISISEELGRQHREELMHEAAIARLAKEARANSDASFGSLRNLRWEFARYAGLISKQMRTQPTK
jgi:hypothetical protein